MNLESLRCKRQTLLTKALKKVCTLSLTFTNAGDHAEVVRVDGNDEAKQHLSDLGFVPGAYVAVVSAYGGDIIANVKDSRLTITQEMVQKIQAQPAAKN